MYIEPTALSTVRLVTPKRHGDDRGYFCEVWSKSAFESAGISVDFVQDNESVSRDVGTVRGLHYQAPPYAQAKLVRVVAGAILDIAVDVRVGSPDFGKWIAAELSAENGRQLLVPRGFLHGFVTLQPDTHVIYKVDNPYHPASDGSVRWDDPDLAIDWGILASHATLSGKDAKAPLLADWSSPFTYDAPL